MRRTERMALANSVEGLVQDAERQPSACRKPKMSWPNGAQSRLFERTRDSKNSIDLAVAEAAGTDGGG